MTGTWLGAPRDETEPTSLVDDRVQFCKDLFGGNTLNGARVQFGFAAPDFFQPSTLDLGLVVQGGDQRLGKARALLTRQVLGLAFDLCS